MTPEPQFHPPPVVTTVATVLDTCTLSTPNMYVDPPRNHPGLLKVFGRINGTAAHILIDGGADGSLISDCFIKQIPQQELLH
jgi:hypothetical protein